VAREVAAVAQAEAKAATTAQEVATTQAQAEAVP